VSQEPSRPIDHAGGNLLLLALPASLRTRLESLGEVVRLDKGQILFHVGDALDRVYFPTAGLVSLMALTSDGGSVEVAAVAREGVVGLPVILKAAESPHQAVVRLPGAALCLRTEHVRVMAEPQSVLDATLSNYAHRVSAEVVQAVACQCFHTVSQRCARWLLSASDRTNSDTLELTHESLASALGVARPVVTKTALGLSDMGAIRYRHGRLTIVNRLLLQRTTCDCYNGQR
jgi:CRP-like cAMP-binding protein